MANCVVMACRSARKALATTAALGARHSLARAKTIRALGAAGRASVGGETELARRRVRTTCLGIDDGPSLCAYTANDSLNKTDPTGKFMDWDAIRPVITGTIGGLLSLWVMNRWAPHVPQAYKDKSAKQLAAEYRFSIVLGKLLFGGTIAIGIVLFQAGYFPRTSWAHFFLIFGVAILSALAASLLPAVGKGRSKVIEAFVAFAISERLPLPVMAAIALIGVVFLASAIGMLL
jgi:hypothetical protein